jgi:hypothetical protein
VITAAISWRSRRGVRLIVSWPASCVITVVGDAGTTPFAGAVWGEVGAAVVVPADAGD